MGRLLKLLGVPEWVAWLALSLATVAGLSAAVLAYGSRERAAGAAEVQARWDAEHAARDRAVISAQARVATIEHQQATKAQEVNNHVQNQLAAVAADRDRAVRAAAGLRDQLAAVRAGAGAVPGAPAGPGGPAQARALADSLSECSERYSALAGERDDLAVQLAGLIDLLPADQAPP